MAAATFCPLGPSTHVPRIGRGVAVVLYSAIHISPDRGAWCSSPRSVVTTYAAFNIQGGIDGWYTLDFLRQLAYFVPWVRKALPKVLADLADTDEAGARAATEYALRAGDATWLLPQLRAWNEASPQWFAAAATFPLAPAGTLDECVTAAIEAAEAEAATAPE